MKSLHRIRPTVEITGQLMTALKVLKYLYGRSNETFRLEYVPGSIDRAYERDLNAGEDMDIAYYQFDWQIVSSTANYNPPVRTMTGGEIQAYQPSGPDEHQAIARTTNEDIYATMNP